MRDSQKNTSIDRFEISVKDEGKSSTADFDRSWKKGYFVTRTDELWPILFRQCTWSDRGMTWEPSCMISEGRVVSSLFSIQIKISEFDITHPLRNVKAYEEAVNEFLRFSVEEREVIQKRVGMSEIDDHHEYSFQGKEEDFPFWVCHSIRSTRPCLLLNKDVRNVAKDVPYELISEMCTTLGYMSAVAMAT